MLSLSPLSTKVTQRRVIGIMGCNTSRLDRLPAVALCRDRCKFLEEALRQSYALADAHLAYMESLKTLGPALHSFFDGIENSGHDDHSSALPKNGNDAIDDTNLTTSSPPAATPDHSSSSSSDSGSHIQLHSDDDTAKDVQISNQNRYESYDYVHHDAVSPAPDNVIFMNYVHPLYAPFSPPHPNSSGYSGPKPPSPPPPSSSAWDFLNFFEMYDKYEVPYIRSPDLKLESEKERVTHRNLKSESAKKEFSGEGKVDKTENGEAKNEGGSMEKKQISENKPPAPEDGSSSAKVKSPKCVSEVTKEIQILFQRASDSGIPILEMLDVGKLRYHRKITVNPGSCKMMHVFTPSVSSKSGPLKIMESSLLGRRMDDTDKGLSYGNLSSTLEKLCMWEKKLYDEVKAEEKLRMLHEKKCKQLRRMKKNGGDAQKIDSIQNFIRILSTKMRISIQVVDNISNTISKLREEELWPQINKFILRFLGMWKDMLECYRHQYQEFAEAKSLDASSFSKTLSGSNLDAAIKLKSEMQNWNLSFSDWIYAQKTHVKALNGWLLRCLMYDPEEIPNGKAPLSPGRIGAPPVFVICNKWSRAMDKLFEKDVTETVNEFIFKVNELLEKHILDLQQKLTVDKELERKVKTLERQQQKMHKVVQARERKMVAVAREETDALLREGDAMHHGELTDSVNLQSGLKLIFATMERFTANATRAYEELCQHIELGSHVLGESNNIR